MHINNSERRVPAKKIVLIQPPSPFLLEPLWTVPLTLCLFKTILEHNGYKVEIVDLADKPSEPPWDIPLDADVYGISVYTPQHSVAQKIAAFLRQNTGGMIICGGHHVTALQEKFLCDSAFDVLVMGEGDETILEICAGIPLPSIKGLLYRQDNRIISTGYRMRLKNLDDIPLPRFDGINLERYRGNYNINERSELRVGVVTSRGCYFKCSFCSSYFFWKQKVTWYSTEKIMDYLNYLNKLGVRSVEFLDDNFVLHPGFQPICALLYNLNMIWTCMGRSDCITEEKAQKLKDSGCSWIALGVESGSDRILQMMAKHSTVADHSRAIKLLNKAGVKVKAFMIAGFPGETDDDAALTEQFIRYEPVDLYSFCAFVPLPGTPIWHNPEKYNAVIDYSVPFEEYLLVSKDFAPRPILRTHQQSKIYLDRYIKAAGSRCTNIKAFERTRPL